MTTLTVELTDAQAGALSRRAEELGVRPEALLRAVALDVIEGRDEPFSAIAQRVIQKNAELYRRLA